MNKFLQYFLFIFACSLVFIAGLPLVLGSPDIMYRNGVNRTLIDSAIQEIDPLLFQGVEKLEFSTYDHKKYSAYYHVRYNPRNNRVLKNKAIFYARSYQNLLCIILHELGHHDEQEKNGGKVPKEGFSETYADDFMKKHNKVCKI